MNNQDRAHKVLEDWVHDNGGMSAIDRDYDGDVSGAVEALADAGLLMPDLPGPDYNTRSLIIWDHVSHSVTYNKFLGVSLIAEVNERSLPNDEAREIAYTLLAAADLAEKSTND